MTKVAALLSLTLGCAAPPEPALVISHVTVIDVAGGKAVPDQTVIIRGRRIASVGDAGYATVPDGAEVIDGSGKYLIPGLWDMHVHLDSADLAPLVRLGVTGARDMGGDLEELLTWRRRIEAGELTGPRLVFAGPMLRGALTPEQGIRAVDSLLARGVDFIKVHEGLSRDTYFAIARRARAKHIPFVGHVPAGIGPVEASEAGQRSIEHLEFVPDACLSIFGPAGTCTPESLDLILDQFAKHDTWLDPTIGSFRVFAPRQWPFIFAGFRDLVPGLRAHNIKMLAGTDLGTTGIEPGASLHDELGLLVDAGFTPAEALRAATLNPARFLGLTDSLGTIEPGKLADLVLLERDPLADIHLTRSIAAVIQGGKVVPLAP